MVHAGCVFIAGICPSRTCMSGSFEFIRWNACMHRLDLGLYSNLKEFLGNGVRTHVNSKRKIPSTGKILLRGRCIKQDSKPNTLPTSYSGPQPGDLMCYKLMMCKTCHSLITTLSNISLRVHLLRAYSIYTMNLYSVLCYMHRGT